MSLSNASYSRFEPTSWHELVCDNNAGVKTQFYRYYHVNPDFSITEFSFDINGNQYVATGTVEFCGGPVPDNLQPTVQILGPGGTVTFAANTINSLSIQVTVGTADINGVTLPTGSIVNIGGDSNSNNITPAQTVDNISAGGSTLVVSTAYV